MHLDELPPPAQTVGGVFGHENSAVHPGECALGMDLDESIDDFEAEGGEGVEGIIDSIKRDFDDEGETF